jgi:tetratricopeptide (TPR) repeat protein
MRKVLELLVRLVGGGSGPFCTLLQRLSLPNEAVLVSDVFFVVFYIIKECLDYCQRRAQSDQMHEIQELLQSINDKVNTLKNSLDERQSAQFLAHSAKLIEIAKRILEADAKGRCISIDLLETPERNNPFAILFLLLYQHVNQSEEQIQQTLQGLPLTISDQLTILLYRISDELERQFEALAKQESLEQLLQEIRQAKEEIAAEVTSYFGQFEALFGKQHRPPLYVLLFTDEKQRRVYRYLPGSRWVPLIGRDQEFQHLCAFLESDARLSWHLVVGSGGQGKSRLALELILYAHERGWHAGFFRRHTSYSDWHRWTPERDTLIVFDYASLQAETIREALLALSEKTTQENCPRLRVLLLERYLDERARWFETLIAKDSSSDRARIESLYHQPPRLSPDEWRLSAHAGIGAQSGEMYAPLSPSRLSETIQPYRLQPLQEDHFLQMMYEYYLQCDQPTQAVLEREQLRDALRALPEGDYRPLFAAFAGEAIATTDIRDGRRWNVEQLVKWVLDRDYAQWRLRGIDQRHANLVAFATVVGGLSIEEATTLGKDHPELFPDFEKEFKQEHYDALTAYTHSESNDRLVGILPDLLGELYILERLHNQYQLGDGYQRAQQDTVQVVQLAWDHTRQTEGTEQHPITAFITRCAGDFPDHPSLKTLLKIQPKSDEQKPVYDATLTIALTRLTTDGSQKLFGEMLQQLPLNKQAVVRLGRGLTYAVQNRLEQAIADYTAVIEMPDASADVKAQALLIRGVAYGLQEKWEKAIADYTAVIEMPDAPAEQKAKALLIRGVAYGLQEKWEKAIADYTAVIEMPDAPAEQKAQALLIRGVAYGLQGDREREIADYTAVIEMPDAPAEQKAKARVNRGVEYGLQEKWEKAIADYTAVIEMPDAPAEQKAQALLIRGVAYGLQGDREREIADYTAVIEMPDAPAEQKAKALFNRGVEYRKQEKWEKAIADYTAVIEMPDAPAEQKAQALFNRGVAYGLQGDREREIADYTAVIEMPDAPAEQKAKALFNRGVEYGLQGDREREIADYTAVIEMPDAPAEQKAQALFNRGVAYGLQGDREREIADYTAVIEMPDAPAEQKAKALFNRGVEYGLQGDREREIADYTAVIEMPDAPAEQKAQALFNRGVAYGLQGDREREIADYTAVIEMPDAPAEQKAQARVNRGVAYGLQGDREREIADYTAVIEMPDAPAEQKAKARVNRGVEYRKQEKWEKAIADYTAVIEMPDAPAEQKAQALFNRGVAYGLQGDREREIADYTAVIEMPDVPDELKARVVELLSLLDNS